MQRQAFRVSDALRCMLVNAPRGENLACPRHGPSGVRTIQNALLWKDALSQPRNRLTLATWQGVRPEGLVSAKTRSGQRVWEIDRLFLPQVCAGAPTDSSDCATPSWRKLPAKLDPADATALELLEQLVQNLGWRSAERVFLRLTEDSPITPLARRGGFFPICGETALQGMGHPDITTAPANPAKNSGAVLRERRPPDDYPLFQLFSAATPHTVRESLGLTFDQWRDSRDPHCRKGAEWVLETEGRLTGWLGVWPGRQGDEVELMLHPRQPEQLDQLLDLAQNRPGPQRWLVPDYQQMVADQLRYRGFHEVGRYTLLNRMVAAPVVCRGMAPVEA